MAFSHNVIYQGTTLLVVEVTATADADLNYTFAHGLDGTPLIVNIDSLGTNGTSNLSFDAYWSIISLDGTNVQIGKSNSAGTGSASPQVRVAIWLPHSVFK